ncbi:MAG: gfo/Idh/MocA family oxidoreductase, partial [Bacteroidia bacterium]|nr:gfo/Idh/MocA family oxidoreductase [Bacteroidia bacterium]
PEAVMAMTQTMKPDIYSKVDDEATILLKYPKTQGIIQASWNWPMSRKDMEVYGQFGYIISENDTDIRYRLNEDSSEVKEKVNRRSPPLNDPFALLAEVVRGNIKLDPYDLSSIENNMIVIEILDAARESAKTGKLIYLEN